MTAQPLASSISPAMKTTAVPVSGSNAFRPRGLLHRPGALPTRRRRPWLAGLSLLLAACAPGQILDPEASNGTPDQPGGAGV